MPKLIIVFIGDDDEGIFEVDYLMDMKVKKGVRYFYVRWKGYDETEDSWLALDPF